MATALNRTFSASEYLTHERAAAYKSQYYGGEIFAMVGGSPRHNLISGNLVGELRQRLRDRPCLVFTSDQRVKVDPTGLYTYPDVTVLCGEPQYDDAERDTLLNPTLLIEVLSPSTADYDRGGKFAQYRRIESLREYLVVAQDQPRVERYRRQAADQWLFTETSEPDAVISLDSIQVELALSEVYLKVEFDSLE